MRTNLEIERERTKKKSLNLKCDSHYKIHFNKNILKFNVIMDINNIIDKQVNLPVHFVSTLTFLCFSFSTMVDVTDAVYISSKFVKVDCVIE